MLITKAMPITTPNLESSNHQADITATTIAQQIPLITPIPTSFFSNKRTFLLATCPKAKPRMVRVNV